MADQPSKSVDPLLSLVAPARRRFLKQLLVGAGVVGALALPSSTVLAQPPQGGTQTGKGKGKAKGRGKGKGKGTGKGKGKGKGKGTNP